VRQGESGDEPGKTRDFNENWTTAQSARRFYFFAGQKLALFPGQAMVSPAPKTTTMMMLIAVAFKALIHMEHTFKTRINQDLPRLTGAFSTPTDEDNRGTSIILGTGLTTQHQLAHFGGKPWVDLPVRLIDPGNVYGTCGMAYKKIFHTRAYIDQYRARVILNQFPGLLGVKIL
jgi:hypothetical protein